MKIYWHKLVVVICIFFVVLSTAGVVSTKAAAAELDYNPRAEQWIQKQLNAGEVADLILEFPEYQDRIVRSEFLVKLLEDPSASIQERGIRIKNAIFTGELIFESMEVDFPIYIETSTFQNYVSLCKGHFRRHFILKGDTFESNVNFCETKFDESLDLDDTIFNGCLTMSYAEIGGLFRMSNSRFESEYQIVSFEGASFGNSVFMGNTVFNGDTNLNAMIIAGDIVLTGTHFTNPKYEARIGALRVTRSFFLGETIFDGGASFRGSQIKGHFLADDVVFNNTEKGAIFNYMVVNGQISLNRAVFNGEASFNELQTDDYFIANDAHFNHSDALINFNGMRVAKTILLNKVVFNGPVTFNNTYVGLEFSANETEFNNVESGISFQNMEVGKQAHIEKSIINGPVNMVYAEIGQALLLSGTRFNSVEGKVNLAQIKVGYAIKMDNAVIEGPLDLRYADLGNFEGNNTKFNNTEGGIYFENARIRDLLLLYGSKFSGIADFSHMYVGGYVSIEDAYFEKPAYFSNMVIDDFLNADRATFVDIVNFSNTSVKSFGARQTIFPEEWGKVIVQDLQYEELYVEDAQEKGFLGLLNQDAFDGEGYKQLEEWYRVAGYPYWADLVHVMYRTRELVFGTSILSLKFLWNLFIGMFVLFGKFPEISLAWFGVIVGIGAFVFRKRDKMIATVESTKKYNPLLYSLDLFLPLVDIGYQTVWKPAEDRKWLRFYVHVHRYFGIILIPVAILAFLGIIK